VIQDSSSEKRSTRKLFAEQTAYDGAAVGENGFNIFSYFQLVRDGTERSERDTVLHFIQDARAVPFCFEPMFMTP